jgi:hypothetical protein
MGENECLGWFPRYTQGKPVCDDVGCATQVWDGSQRPNVDDYLEVREFIPPKDTKVIPKEDFMEELGGKPHMMEFDTPNCKVSYNDNVIVFGEFTKIFTPQNDGIKPLSEETAQHINESFENIRKTMEKDFPMTFAKRKARKYYKPKFTL